MANIILREVCEKDLPVINGWRNDPGLCARSARPFVLSAYQQTRRGSRTTSEIAQLRSGAAYFCQKTTCLSAL